MVDHELDMKESDEMEFLRDQLRVTFQALVRKGNELDAVMRHKNYLEQVVLSGDGFTCEECDKVFGDDKLDGVVRKYLGVKVCEDCGGLKYPDVCDRSEPEYRAEEDVYRAGAYNVTKESK